MLDCKQATEMVLKKRTEKLGFMDKLNLFMHLSLCKFCSMFEKQNALIDEGVQKLDDLQLENLPEASKIRIGEKIQK